MPDFEFPDATMAGRIERRLSEIGRSASAVSEEATGKKDAIRKIYNAARAGEEFNPRVDTLQGLARVMGRTVGWMTGEEESPSSLSPPVAASGDLAYAGIAQAGLFRPVDEYFNQDEAWDRPDGLMRHPSYPRARQYAWKVGGKSMDLAGIADGQWIVGADASDYVDQYGDIESGDLVVVQRTRFQGSERELTVKEIRYYRDRYELHPRSSDPSFKPIIVANDQTADDEEVTVVGVVLSAFTDLRRRR
jgi:SOS-response transcriptional repressor LexA